MKALSLLLLSLASLLQARPTDPSATFANDLQLMGGIGNYPILVQLQGDFEEEQWPADCVPVTGSYFYKSVMQPIQLEGTVCLEKNAFLLYHDKGGANEERFEGRLRDGLLHWEGTWKKGTRELDLDVTELQELAGDAAPRLLADYIHHRLQMEVDEQSVDDARVDRAGLDEGGRPFVEGFESGWQGEIGFFSPTRLEYRIRYSSTMRFTTNGYTYQVMADGKHVLELAWWENYDKDTDESDFGYDVSLWRRQGSGFETVDAFPEGMQLSNSGSSVSEEEMEMYVEAGPDRLKLRLGEQDVLLKWEEGSWVK